jgi:ubiquitin-conjugating enzyme E2 Z
VVKQVEAKTKLWDPFKSPDFDDQSYSSDAIVRIKRDLTVIFDSPLPGICVKPDGDDITRLHILITGPFDTPYEGGFFYFYLRVPPNYPHSPPRVRFMTTGGGRVRFNPNLYQNGKVCLSILGTWAGPGWTTSQSLLGVVLSIQTLMCEKPYHNEPGYEQERKSGDVLAYNNIIRYETLRTSVCECLEESTYPKDLLAVVRESFLEYYEIYQMHIEEGMSLHGKPIYDPLYGFHKGTYDYKSVQKRMDRLYKLLTANSQQNDLS